jgi:hypothetical protein
MAVPATGGRPEREQMNEVVLLPADGTPLVVPSDRQLAVMREQAKRDGTLHDLRQALAACKDVAAKCRGAHEQHVRLGLCLLEVERDLGVLLTQTVSRGRPKKRSHDATFSKSHELPSDITKQQALRYRALAAIPEEAFRAYLAHAASANSVPSAAGAKRFGVPAEPKPRPAKREKQSEALELPAAVFDAISRIMTPDVCVGTGNVGAKACVAPDAKDIFDRLRGDVVVLKCPDPAKWLTELRRRRSKGQVQQAVVVLLAEVWTSWFRELRETEWSMCFLEGVRAEHGAGVIVAHHGARASAFRVALGSLGALA